MSLGSSSSSLSNVQMPDMFGPQYPMEAEAVQTASSFQGEAATIALPSSWIEFIIYIVLVMMVIVFVIGAIVLLADHISVVADIKRVIWNALGIAEYGARQVGGSVEKVAGPVVRPIEKASSGIAGTVGTAIDELENELNPFHERGTTSYISPDDADSDIQIAPKAGYCYVGKDKGSRTCAYVGKNDTCMSGKVYPSMDICINPSLRA